MLENLGFSLADLRQKETTAAVAQKVTELEGQAEQLAANLHVGLLTLRDILAQLTRPGRDPREDLPPPIFKQGIIKLDDLQPGMELMGSVLNVVDFGAFVDIGLHDSGLVHVSQLANRYVRDPHEVVSVGDIVKVWVMEIDKTRRRVSLTMIAPGTPKHEPRPRPARGEGRRSDRPQGDRPPRRGAAARWFRTTSTGGRLWRRLRRARIRIDPRPHRRHRPRRRRRPPTGNVRPPHTGGGRKPFGRQQGGRPPRPAISARPVASQTKTEAGDSHHQSDEGRQRAAAHLRRFGSVLSMPIGRRATRRRPRKRLVIIRRQPPFPTSNRLPTPAKGVNQPSTKVAKPARSNKIEQADSQHHHRRPRQRRSDIREPTGGDCYRCRRVRLDRGFNRLVHPRISASSAVHPKRVASNCEIDPTFLISHCTAVNFDERLQQAIQRGTRAAQARHGAEAAQALSEEQFKRLHSQYRLQLSEHVEKCLRRLPQHFPGFQFETVVSDRGWGAAVNRDDADLGPGRPALQFVQPVGNGRPAV